MGNIGRVLQQHGGQLFRRKRPRRGNFELDAVACGIVCGSDGVVTFFESLVVFNKNVFREQEGEMIIYV